MLLEPANQAGHLDAACAIVGMHLVEHQELQALIEEHPIILAQQ